MGILLLEVVVNIEQRVADQLHPQLFHLVDDLELQLVPVAEAGKVFLAGEQLFGVQIQLVVERTFPVHDGIKILSVH